MTARHQALDVYLTELSPLLTGPAHERRRSLDEIQDHILSEVEERQADGQAEPAAVTAALSRVGDARTVAAAFAEVRARRAFERATHLTLAAVVAFGALFVLSTQVTDLRAQGIFTQGVAGVVGWFASQVAAVAVVIAWLRSRRLRAAAQAGPAALFLSLRAAAVAAGSALVALGLDAVAAFGPWRAAPVGYVIGAVLALALASALAAALSVALAAIRVRPLTRLDDGRADTGASALEELRWATLGALERADAGSRRTPGMLRGAAAATADVADRTLTWALARRARTAALVGAAAGAILAMGSLHEHGLVGGPRSALLSVGAAALIFAVEAGAVIASVYLLDGALRLWPARAHTRQVAR